MGDLVFDSFNIAYRDEYIILDQIYEKQIYTDPFCADFKLLEWLKQYSTLQ